MPKINFHLHTYSISCADQHIALIRKEFELLQYLYEQLQRPCSREQILDAVWSMESPTDRTVDDHIYRLRKKLQPIEHLYSLDTIRGYGYQLSSKQTGSEPIIADQHFITSSEHLLRTYHLYGNGQALDLLLSEKTLGIQPSKEIQLSHAFMKGDFERIILDKETSFSEKLLFLLHLLMYGAPHTEVFHYYQLAIQKNRFSARSIYEAETLFPLYLYLRTKQFEQAKLVMERSEAFIDSEEHGFYPFFCNCKLIYGLCTQDKQLVHEQIHRLDHFFQHRVYIREKGVFTVLLGIHALLEGQKSTGNEKVQEGLSLLNQAQIVSHYFLSLDILRLFFELGLEDAKLEQWTNKKWESMLGQFNIEQLKKSILHQLQENL